MLAASAASARAGRRCEPTAPRRSSARCAALARRRAELEALAARLRAERPRRRGGDRRDRRADGAPTRRSTPRVERGRAASGLPAAAAILDGLPTRTPTLIAALPDRRCSPRAPTTCARSAAAPRARRAGRRGDGRRADGRDAILVAEDLGPADVAELGDGVRRDRARRRRRRPRTPRSSRAALGVPMVVGLGADAARARPPGEPSSSTATPAPVVVAPGAERAGAARVAPRSAASARARARRGCAALPAETLDGHRVRVLVERRRRRRGGSRACAAGAEGIGLLRTELAFLEATRVAVGGRARRGARARSWRALAGRTATVRVLDFGARQDAAVPAPATPRARHRAAARRARRAARAAARDRRGAGAHRAARPAADGASRRSSRSHAVRAALPRVGIGAAARRDDRDAGPLSRAAPRSPRAADFMSIGTNDLTAAVLGADRFAPGAQPGPPPARARRDRRDRRAAAHRAAPRRGLRRGGLGPGRAAAAGRARRGRAERRRRARRRGPRVGARARPRPGAELAARALWARAPTTCRRCSRRWRSACVSRRPATQPREGVERERRVVAVGRSGVASCPPFAPSARTERRLFASASRSPAATAMSARKPERGAHEVRRRPRVQVDAGRQGDESSQSLRHRVPPPRR